MKRESCASLRQGDKETHKSSANPEGEDVASSATSGVNVVVGGGVAGNSEGGNEAGDGPRSSREDLEDLSHVPHETLGPHGN